MTTFNASTSTTVFTSVFELLEIRQELPNHPSSLGKTTVHIESEALERLRDKLTLFTEQRKSKKLRQNSTILLDSLRYLSEKLSVILEKGTFPKLTQDYTRIRQNFYTMLRANFEMDFNPA